MRGADRRDHRPPRPRAARVRGGRGHVRGRPEHVVLRGARRVRPDAPLPRPHVAAPLRVPAARLRRVHDVLASSARASCRTSPTSTSRRWSPGSTCSSSSRAPSCASWRSSRSTPASTACSSRGARRPRSTPSWRESEAGRAWLEALERDQGPVVQHGDRRRPLPLLPQLVRRPEHRLRVGRRPRAGAPGRARRSSARREELARERDRLAEEYGALLDEETRATFDELLELSRTVFPYVEEHKFFCDYWFLTRWWNKVREFGALLATHGFLEDARGRLPARPPRGRAGARRARPDVGDRRRAARPGALAADRRPAQGAARAARRVDAAAGDRRDARGDHRPGRDHALGRDDAARPGVGAARRRAAAG